MRKRTVFKALRLAHGYSGAVLAGLLILIGATGCLLIFKDDYVRWQFPEARQGVDASPEGLARTIREAEDVFGAGEVRTLVFGTPEMALSRAYLADGRSAYLSPDRRVLAVWDENGRLEDWLLDLHHRLLSGTPGLWIAGFAGLAASILVLTGLLAVWPARLGLRRGLKITGVSRIQMLSLHRNLWASGSFSDLSAHVDWRGTFFPRGVETRYGAGSRRSGKHTSGRYELIRVWFGQDGLGLCHSRSTDALSLSGHPHGELCRSRAACVIQGSPA